MSKNRNSIWRSAMGFAIALPILQIAALPAFGQERGPLTLAKSSYFFVGGGIDTSLEGSPMVGQMYVEYMIPQRQRHPYPVVMVHGGGQTGTNFTGTPDGREGWAQYFVRRGYAVYVVDQVARGRAAYWDQAFGALPPARLSFVEQRFVAPEQDPKWPQAHLHTQFPGAGNPGDGDFDQFYASQFPSIASFPQQQQLNRAALVALLDKIGPAIVLVHSQSGAYGLDLIRQHADKVRAFVDVEGSCGPLSADDVAKSFRKVPTAIVFGDFTEGSNGPNNDERRKLCSDSVAAINGAGGTAKFMYLPALGIKGNGHMMMMEKNNLQIADLIIDWLGQTTAFAKN